MKKVLAITLLFVALPVQGMLRSIARLSASTRSKVLLPVLKQQKRFEHKQGLNQHTYQVATDNQNSDNFIEKWRKIKSLLDTHGSRTDALVAALKGFNHEMINTILPVMSSSSVLWCKDKDGNLPINIAIRLGNDAAIDYILERAATMISRKDAKNYSPILTAIDCNNFEALAKILKILKYTETGGTGILSALEFAAHCGNKKAVEMILKSFSWAIDNSQALEIALKREDWEMVVMLVAAGAKL